MTNWKYTIKGIPAAIRIAEDGDKAKSLLAIVDILVRQDVYVGFVDNDPTMTSDEIASGEELWGIVEEMEWAINEASEGLTISDSYYNALLGAMYDWADYNAVWIDPTE